MNFNNVSKVLHIHDSLAVKINPAFYQLLNEKNMGWFYERFINLVSYDKQGQQIIDFIDNHSSVYESRIKTKHIYGVDELSVDRFCDFIVESVLNDQYVNLWCDEYYIRDSDYYRKHHFVHPLTVYGVIYGRVCCEFFSISCGMILIEVPIQDLQRAFFSIKKYYAQGSSYEVLKEAISTYEIREPNSGPFDLSIFIQELSDYWYGQANPYKKQEYPVPGCNITYGITYYNNLFALLRDAKLLSSFPYKCLFDLHLHKLFLIERLDYIRRHIGFDEEYNTLISEVERIAEMYERMNMLNIKYNIKDQKKPYTLSQNSAFKEKLTSIIESAYQLETNTIPKIITYLAKVNNNQYENHMEYYSIEESENVTILYPNFEEYIQQISIRIDSALDEKIPVTMQLSNGNQYFLDSAVTRTYLFRPAKITWIKFFNCKSLEFLHIGDLFDKSANKLKSCDLSSWRPMNHIDNWRRDNTAVKFDICGVDPYMICEGVNIDAHRYPYISITYSTDDLAKQAQLFYMTEESMQYTKEQSQTFNLSNSHDKYTYKLDMSDKPQWANIVTLLRLDPVHYPAQYEKEHISSQCSIYDIIVSSIPVSYSSKMDYAGNQCVNQWEYSCYKNDVSEHLYYDCYEQLWKNQYGVCIGKDFQKGLPGVEVSRNWRCPSNGSYKVLFSGECEIHTEISIIVDEEFALYKSYLCENPYYENIVQLKKDSLLRFACEKGILNNISIEIYKIE